ncbi:hypothetical protein ACFX2F_032787 [Malus domestica]
MGNNTYVDVLGEGDCKINNSKSTTVLKNVMLAPNIRRNLVTVSVLEKKGFKTKFMNGDVTIGKKGYIYHKNEALDKFKEFKAEVENQLGRSIKTLNSDRCGEFEAFDNFWKENELESLEEEENSPMEDQDFHLDLDLSHDHDIDNDQVGDVNMGDHNNGRS